MLGKRRAHLAPIIRPFYVLLIWKLIKRKVLNSPCNFLTSDNSFNPNRIRACLDFVFFRRVDFVWLLMSNSRLLRIRGLISKPSRQLADSCLMVNYLDARMLWRKIRWSDSFSEILVFTKNQRYGQLFAHIDQLKSIPLTGLLMAHNHMSQLSKRNM